MKKILTYFFIISLKLCFSQVSDLQIITKQKDTIKNVVFEGNINNATKRYKFQDKIVYVDSNMQSIKLLPAQVMSFSFKYNGQIVRYESRDDKIFALVLYSNKLKILRFVRPAYTPVDIYVVERPNGSTSFLEAMGLSRRISLKVIKRELFDCPNTISKVENDILKVQGEEGVLELFQDYEKNCF